MERHLLWIRRHSFHLYGSTEFSGTEDKRSNILTKDVSIALIAQEIPRVLWAVDEGPIRSCVWKPNIY